MLKLKVYLKSRFLLIIGILVIVSSVVMPVIGFIAEQNRNSDGGGGIVRPLPITGPTYSVVEIEIAYSENVGQESLL